MDVVRWLVASQAQEFAGAKWALALRTKGATDSAVERAFDDGAILRTHMMRPTWHFVSREDIRWMQALTAPRVNAISAYRYRQLELDAAAFRKAERALARALEEGRHLTRDELRLALGRAGIGSLDGQRMAHILMHAELEALVCSGPRRGRQFTYALLDDRAPRARALPREEALAELAGRYFRSRGPATVRDFAKWSGLTIADARAGLEAVKSKLRREAADGEVYWSGAPAPAARRGPRTAHLLSVYDEYVSSYKDRRAICRPGDAKRLLAMGNALAYLVLVDGRVAGTWRRTFEKRAVRIWLTLFRPLRGEPRRAVAAAAERFARFNGRELELAFA